MLRGKRTYSEQRGEVFFPGREGKEAGTRSLKSRTAKKDTIPARSEKNVALSGVDEKGREQAHIASGRQGSRSGQKSTSGAFKKI